MRIVGVLLASVLFAATTMAGAASPSAPGREAIIEILTKAKSWSVLAPAEF